MGAYWSFRDLSLSPGDLRLLPLAILALLVVPSLIYGGIGFALLAAKIQLLAASPLSMALESRAASSALLIAAGAYQLSPLKDACLGRCRSPAEFITRHYRPGSWGAARLGLLHGAYCVGCCWLLMALLFVGGVMNLLWVAGLTLLVAAEKLLPGGPWIARTAGAAMIGWGVLLLAS